MLLVSGKLVLAAAPMMAISFLGIFCISSNSRRGNCEGGSRVSKSLKWSELERQTSNVVTMPERRTKSASGFATAYPNRLNLDELTFSQIYVQTGSPTQAGKAIGLKDPAKQGPLWLSKPKISQYVIALEESIRTEFLRQEALRTARSNQDMDFLVRVRLLEVLRSPQHRVRGYADLLKAAQLVCELARQEHAQSLRIPAQRPVHPAPTYKSSMLTNFAWKIEVTTPPPASETLEKPSLPEARRPTNVPERAQAVLKSGPIVYRVETLSPPPVQSVANPTLANGNMLGSTKLTKEFLDQNPASRMAEHIKRVRRPDDVRRYFSGE
jgi:hypothetical protein